MTKHVAAPTPRPLPNPASPQSQGGSPQQQRCHNRKRNHHTVKQEGINLAHTIPPSTGISGFACDAAPVGSSVLQRYYDRFLIYIC